MSKRHGKHGQGQRPGETDASAPQRDVSHRGGGKKAKAHIKAEAEGESGAEVRPLLHRPGRVIALLRVRSLVGPGGAVGWAVDAVGRCLWS